jgi:hypothetical protein
MGSFYQNVVAASWAVWVVYWLISAANVKATARLESLSSRAAHFRPMVVALVLLASRPQ